MILEFSKLNTILYFLVGSVSTFAMGKTFFGILILFLSFCLTTHKTLLSLNVPIFTKYQNVTKIPCYGSLGLLILIGLYVLDKSNVELFQKGLSIGFLLASIAVFGEDGWEQYWKDLRNNDIEIRSGWTEAYYEDFYSKERNIVTSYATSPIAEYIFSDPPLSKPPTGVVGDSCFRSIEFVGILRGTDSPVASAMLIEFLTSTYFQELIPETNFVLPANKKAELPETFKKFLKTDLEPVMIAPELIELKRNEWTESWTQIVLR